MHMRTHSQLADILLRHISKVGGLQIKPTKKKRHEISRFGCTGHHSSLAAQEGEEDVKHCATKM